MHQVHVARPAAHVEKLPETHKTESTTSTDLSKDAASGTTEASSTSPDPSTPGHQGRSLSARSRRQPRRHQAVPRGGGRRRCVGFMSVSSFALMVPGYLRFTRCPGKSEIGRQDGLGSGPRATGRRGTEGPLRDRARPTHGSGEESHNRFPDEFLVSVAKSKRHQSVSIGDRAGSDRCR